MEIKERKIVPVVARISAGKSKLLNVIYNINFLECKAGISTKFINLLRYNPNIHKPRFFHLNIKKKGDKYQFYQDANYKIVEGEKNIIAENKIINERYRKGQHFNYEDIFYMTEINNSPFIKDEEYLLTHDLCDIPGLSEAQTNIENEIKTDNEESKIDDDKKKKIEISNDLIASKDKKEDDIFYHLNNEKNTYLSEIFNIIKDYIDGGIIILSIENYYFRDNYNLISKFHKVINKTITNFLIILNKVDLCLDSEELNQHIENCKGRILKYFPSCKTFNLNLNTFVPLSALRLQDELLLKENFKHLMKYHLSNYASRIRKLRQNNDFSNYITFIEYLKEIIKLKERIEQIDKKALNNLTDFDKNYIKDVLNEIKNDYQKEDINIGVNYDVNNNININMNDNDIINYLYICHKENKLIPLPSEETYNLVNYFRNDKKIIQIEKKLCKINHKEDGTMILKHNIINNINDIISKLKGNILLNEEIYGQLDRDYLKLSDLEKEEENNIFIPLLGPKNVGKTTILNCIIGEDIFPIDKPTQKIFIINHTSDSNEDINIRKVRLVRKKRSNGNIYYDFDFNDEYIIAKGLHDVRETIKGLNYKFADKFSSPYLENPENYFYLIKTKIKLFDKEIDEDIKQKIYLFDFPGFENKNEVQNFIESYVLNIFKSFIFIIRESLIDNYSSQRIIREIFTKSMEQKGKFYEGFVKYCLFILNLDNNEKEFNKQDSYKAKIKSMLNSYSKNIDINLCPFKAKRFISDINNHQNFYNIKNTVNSSFRAYCKTNSSIYKYPENYNVWVKKKRKFNNSYIKDYESFPKFFLNKIENDLKEIFINDLPKEQEINNEVKNTLNESINDLELPNYNIKIEFNDAEKKFLYTYFSFAQSKLSYSEILKKNNFNFLKDSIFNIIKIANNENYSIFKAYADNLCKKLDLIFKTDFNQQKENYYNNFKDKVDELIKKITEFSESQKKKINELKKDCITKINKILETKKKGIIDETLKGKKKDIKQSILEDIKSELKKLNNYINDIFNSVVGTGNSYFLDIKKIFLESINSQMEIEIDDIKNFRNFFFSIILNKGSTNNDINIIDDLSNEIQIYFLNALSKIFGEKGFLESLKSIVSRSSYFSNFIEIIQKYLSDRITYILDILSRNLVHYINDKIELIQFRINLYAIKYSEQEIQRIGELGNDWNKILETDNYYFIVYYILSCIQ